MTQPLWSPQLQQTLAVQSHVLNISPYDDRFGIDLALSVIEASSSVGAGSGFVAMIDDQDACFFVEQATRCWRLTQGSGDWQLVELGREFTERALALGADPADLPEEWLVKHPAHPYPQLFPPQGNRKAA